MTAHGAAEPGNGNGDELRGSTPVMSAKDLLLEVYYDMRVVRPAVESLVAADLQARVAQLESDRLVIRVAAAERGRIGSLTNKGLLFAIVVIQFLLGVWVTIASQVVHRP